MSVLKAHCRGISLSGSVATMEKTYAFDSGLSTVMRSKLECFKSIAFMRCYTELALIFFFFFPFAEILKRQNSAFESEKNSFDRLIAFVIIVWKKSQYLQNKQIPSWLVRFCDLCHSLVVKNCKQTSERCSLVLKPTMKSYLPLSHSCFVTITLEFPALLLRTSK